MANRYVLSIVLPIHTIPNEMQLKRMKSWVSQLDGNFQLLIIVDEREYEKKVHDWCLSELSQFGGVILRGDFSNPGGTRNLGISNASGSWICFVDYDDVLESRKVLDVVRENGKLCDVIVCQYSKQFDGRDKKTAMPSNTKNLSRLCWEPAFWRVIIRREVLENITFPSLRMGEDQLFLAKVLTKAKTICFSKVNIYHYFIGSSHQLTSDKKNLKDLIEINKLFRQHITKENPKLEIWWLMMYWRQSITLIRRNSLKFNMNFIASNFHLLFSIKGASTLLRLLGAGLFMIPGKLLRK